MSVIFISHRHNTRWLSHNLSNITSNCFIGTLCTSSHNWAVMQVLQDWRYFSTKLKWLSHTLISILQLFQILRNIVGNVKYLPQVSTWENCTIMLQFSIQINFLFLESFNGDRPSLSPMFMTFTLCWIFCHCWMIWSLSFESMDVHECKRMV